MPFFTPRFEQPSKTQDSLIHTLNARAKLIGFFILLITCLQARNLASLGLCFGCFLIVLACAHMRISSLLARTSPFLLIIGISTLLNIFALSQESLSHLQNLSSSVALPPSIYLVNTEYVSITYEGFLRALFIGLRLALMAALMMTLTLTTNMYDLVQALVQLLRPLEKLGFPLAEFACIVGLALRFVPEFYTEIERLRAAFQARSGSFAYRRTKRDKKRTQQRSSLFAGGFMRFLMPLGASLIRRSHTLSLAFDARCFKLMPLKPQHPNNLESADSSFILICLSVFIIVFALGLNNACTGLFCRLV